MDEVFGRYRLIEVIGEGGMGCVYRAHDAMMGRDVAIKVLPAELASEPGYRERFRREAYTAARLTEPHIITIYEAGEIDGRLYLAMPIIDGIDLHSLLKRDGAMAPRLAVKVVEQIAAALGAAHAAGLVHRDVKPSNTLMIANEFVYLIDFGIAHDASETRLTHTGSIVGTFAYMAPERFSSGTADARADVYALACVFYECLTGQLPFPGDSLEQQVAGHLTKDAPRPSVVNPATPVGFDEVIARGMAKNPDQRYQTAQQLAVAAGHALTEAPRLARSEAGPVPAPRPSVGHLGQPSGPYSGPQPIAPVGALAPRYPATPQPFTPVGPLWAAGPAQSRGSRQRWIIAGGGAAAAIVMAAVVVVAILGRSPTTPTSSETSTSSNAHTTSRPPTQTVAPERLDSILVSVQDVNTLMGASGMQPEEAIFHSVLKSPGTMSNPDCFGTVFVAQQPLYQGSGYSAISGQELHEPGTPYAHLLEQVAVSFPSADLALAFLKNSADKWRACAGQTVAEIFNGQSDRWIVGDLGGIVPTIVQRHALEGGSWACQHVLSAVSNLVLEVNACSAQISDQARQIADQMATTAARG